MISTLAASYPDFLDDLADTSQLRASTVRAYRYERSIANGPHNLL